MKDGKPPLSDSTRRGRAQIGISCRWGISGECAQREAESIANRKTHKLLTSGDKDHLHTSDERERNQHWAHQGAAGHSWLAEPRNVVEHQTKNGSKITNKPVKDHTDPDKYTWWEFRFSPLKRLLCLENFVQLIKEMLPWTIFSILRNNVCVGALHL